MIRDTFHLVTRSFLSRCLRTAFVFACILALSQLGQAAPTVDPLNLFKNYFITGDAASIGVPARGTGDPNTNLSAPLDLHIPWCNDGDTLRLKCVPKYVDNQGQARQTPTTNQPTVRTQIIAAFVYFEVLEKTQKPSGAKGYALDPGVGQAPVNPDPAALTDNDVTNDHLSYPTPFFGKPIGADRAAPCWSSGGSTGFSNGAPTLRVYRVDYLRYLKFDTESGERIPWARIQVPDSGSNGNTVPLSEGASLFVAYRNYKLPFRGVVLYDGAFTMNQKTDSLDQTIKGFYQSALQPDLTTDQSQHTKFTHIVGDGQSNFPEILTLGTSPQMLNQFNGPFWDDLTYDVSSFIAAGADSFKTTVTHGSGSYDCLTWGALWISTPVQDSDGDGLLDPWESPDGFTEIVSGKKINIAWWVGNQRRGADPCVRNILIEVDWSRLYEPVGNVRAHTHAFSETALNMVTNALKNAGGLTPETGSIPPTGPVLPNCRNGIGAGIVPFFDVGNNLQSNPNVIPKEYAEGGDELNEKSGATYCTLNTQFPQSCVFPNLVGVISWKKGVHHIQKAHVPGTGKQYFSDYRFHLYHWALLGHFLAIRGTKLPNVPGFPDQYQANSTSGKADLPGGDFIVTHGGWRFTNPLDAYRGSTNLEAFTFLHELAHNLWGFHGGVELKRDPVTKRVTQGMNCKMNQQSVLNYGYHSLGVLDEFGNAKADLSGEAIVSASNAEQESALLEGLGVASSATDTSESKYRLRWFAPAAAVEQLLRIPPGTLTPVRAHCDGTPLLKNPTTGLPTETPMVRVDRLGMSADVLKRLNVDWNYDGTISGSALTPLDLNFDGYKDETSTDFKGINDWLHILEFHGLQQISTRRSVYALSAGVGRTDLLLSGETADSSEQDVSEQDVSEQDVSPADLSEQDVSEQDVSEQDVSEQDVSQPDPNTLEIDANTAGGSAPSALTATVSKQPKAIVLSWQPPTAGAAIKYTIYRVTVGSSVPPVTFVLTGTPPATTYNDTSVKNETYIYWVTASFDDSRTPSSTDASTDTLSFADPTGWVTGTPATVAATGGGLTAGTTYYLNVPSATTATFHLTYADAIAGTNKVDLTGSVTATVVVESTSSPSNLVQIAY